MSWHVLLRKGEAGLTEDSIAKCEQILTVPKDQVEPAALGAPLGPQKMREIERAILSAIGVVLPN